MIRPDSYFLVTIQKERFSECQEWIAQNSFYQINLPNLNTTQVTK